MSGKYCDQSDPNQGVASLFPPGSVPEDRTQKVPPPCAVPLSQRYVTGVLRQLLIHHFGDPRNVIDSQVRKYLESQNWSEDAPTGIYIEAVSRWRPEMVETRPAVLIKEGAWRWRRLGANNAVDVDILREVRKFIGLWQGSHTLFCVSRQGAEAQNIAMETARVLQWYSSEIADQFRLQNFTVLQIGALSALKESKENYAVPVVVGYVVEEAWQLQADAPRFQRLVFRS